MQSVRWQRHLDPLPIPAHPEERRHRTFPPEHHKEHRRRAKLAEWLRKCCWTSPVEASRKVARPAQLDKLCSHCVALAPTLRCAFWPEAIRRTSCRKLETSNKEQWGVLDTERDAHRFIGHRCPGPRRSRLACLSPPNRCGLRSLCVEKHNAAMLKVASVASSNLLFMSSAFSSRLSLAPSLFLPSSALNPPKGRSPSRA